jgi:sterol desaturase/sphingolipid hydroxylase (fatty acid hydroxylase superfamily)
VRLPVEVERRLNSILVTPRMNGIHHSTVRAERDANWSSGLVLWDRLHGTLKLNVPQEEIEIGLAAYRAPEELGLLRLLKLPFDAARLAEAATTMPDAHTASIARRVAASDHLLA